MNPDLYNRLRMPVLTVLVMEAVRELHAPGGTLTQWQVSTRILNQHNVPTDARRQTYQRIGTALHSLKSAGFIAMDLRWSAEEKRMHNYIALL